jgi:thiol-disulfide isomerase/thioredoxin
MKIGVVTPMLILGMVAFAPSVTAQVATPRILAIDTAGYREALFAARGGPVLVNFWATWCVPCIEEFPDILRLRDVYAPRGLTVVLVSIDRPADAQTKVPRFLRSHGVEFTTYIKKGGNDEGFINAVSNDWSGALPATALYDSRGVLKEILVDKQSFTGLVHHIEPLLSR